MKKRGQFYITAAIIIVLALFSIASVATFSIVKQEPRSSEEFGEFLNIETPRAITYGTVNEEDVGNFIYGVFSEDVQELIPAGSNITLIYGNETYLNMTELSQENSGTVSASGIGTQTDTTQAVKKVTGMEVTVDEDGTTLVKIYDRDFKFRLGKKEMFYFVFIKEEEGESYVETNTGQR